MAVSFRVARNPEPGSKLPYLLSVPVPDGPLLLKARETCPRYTFRFLGAARAELSGPPSDGGP